MAIDVVAYSPLWPRQFEDVAGELAASLKGVESVQIEHVGSTAVPGLAAKPVLDIDVIVDAADVPRAIEALALLGYVHLGDLGLAGREALSAPDDDPRRHVYVCARGTLHVRNHLAVRDVLRGRDDLRDAYAEAKLGLAADPAMDIDTYLAAKSPVLQRILAATDLAPSERAEILRLNGPGRA